MPDELWAVGDVQGYLSTLERVLGSVGLVDARRAWSGGASTLAVVGDLVDRGPDGLGVIDFLMRLQQGASAAGGRVVVLLGNHDVLLLAARRFGEPFLADWLDFGGVQRDLEGLTDVHLRWLSQLPAMAVCDATVLLHADATFYLDYGSSVAEVNAAFLRILQDDDRAAWERLLDQFSAHRAFLGSEGEANLERFLHISGTRRLVHGHTPLPRMLEVPPETATAAYEYHGGRCVNVDPGIYLGGPGFAYRVPSPA